MYQNTFKWPTESTSIIISTNYLVSLDSLFGNFFLRVWNVSISGADLGSSSNDDGDGNENAIKQ